MSADLLLGVDVGTGAVKAALYDTAGEARGGASVPTRLHHGPGGSVEQDPREMEDEVARAIRGALADARATGDDVAALAMDGQMAGVLFVDADGAAVGPFDSWLDTRCARDVADLAPHAERITAACGGAPTFSAGPKARWWLRERPEAMARARAMVMPSAYLAGRLCGLRGDDAYADPTYLHFSCLADTGSGTWSSELAGLLGVPERLLPRIVEPTEVVGEVTRAAADATGLRPGTPVAAGCGDTAAGLLGAGVVRHGVALDVAGSASVFAICVDAFRPDVAGRTLLTARTALPGTFYALGYVQGGGLTLEWFRRTLAPDLAGNDPDQRGLLHGFGWSHERAHLYRALLEGIAFEYGLYLRTAYAHHPGLAVGTVRAVGGGASSRVWGGIKADVLRAAYRPLRRQEGGALGCAILAGAAVGLLADPAAAAERFNDLADGPDPDPERTRLYDRLQDGYAPLLAQAAATTRARGAAAALPPTPAAADATGRAP